jgi:hypothetical protein
MARTRKGRVLRAGHDHRFVVEVSVPPAPDAESKAEFARLVVEGLRGVTQVHGRLRVFIEYVKQGGRKS